jgi:hypothetical protein
MAWPPQLGQLLARSDSRAAQALRWGLRGLQTVLQAVLEEVPDDSGCEDLRGLLAELAPLLQPALPSDTGSSVPAELPPAPASEPPPAATATPRLLSLARAVAADPRFGDMLKRHPLQDGTDDQIWNGVQRLLLRAPPAVAEEWRQRCLTFAGEAGARQDETRTVVLPLTRDEVIYPGLSGAVEAMGLRAAPAAEPDSRVPLPADSDLRFLGGFVSACLWFAENDPQLHHCLASVFRFGVAPLAGEQRQRYVAELLRLWTRVVRLQGLKERIKGRLNLDEALHSLVYLPPADPESWWGRLYGEARATLLRERDRVVQAGCAVHLQCLSGSFADVNRLTRDSLEVDFGVPGEVAACLRPWARLDGEELKGRVLYRPPREEA